MTSKNVERLTSMWRHCGVEPGDVLLVHSSISRTVRTYQVSPEEILQSFLDAVGATGTLLLPLFNFDFARGVPFDIRNTPSQMGALTEAGRRHPDALRTGHPIYSFAVIGAQADRFQVDNFSGYGPDSPFAILRELNGKIGVLDLLDQDSMTFYHHVEEMHELPYRYHKRFTGAYTDWDGHTTERTYGLFVRDLDQGVETFVHPMGEILWDEGYYQGDRPWVRSGFRVISARRLYDRVAAVIQAGQARNVLYRIRRT